MLPILFSIKKKKIYLEFYLWSWFLAMGSSAFGTVELIARMPKKTIKNTNNVSWAKIEVKVWRSKFYNGSIHVFVCDMIDLYRLLG